MSIATTRPLPARACGYARAVSPRMRARILVGLAAAASAALELGVLVRDDEEARALRDAEALLDEGDREEARVRFAELADENPRSVEAAVGAAIAAWPEGTVERLEALVAESPDSGVARLHLGLALLASGDEEGAAEQWRQVGRRDPDTPPALVGLTPAEQLAELRRRGASGGVEAKLAYGIALQRVGRPVSTREAFA